MKNKSKISRAVSRIFGFLHDNGFLAFCNIAEGTHAGAITMRAGCAIESQNLIVKQGEIDGEFLVADVADKPIGVCVDEGVKGDGMSVILGGCAESTFVCKTSSDITAGDSVYTSVGGKVSSIARNGSYKVGVALHSATAGSVVEIDPVGFGTSALAIHSCGEYVWNSSVNTEILSLSGVSEKDIVIASLSAIGGSEKYVRASLSEEGITFTLDASGTADTTKISWIVIRKN